MLARRRQNEDFTWASPRSLAFLQEPQKMSALVLQQASNPAYGQPHRTTQVSVTCRSSPRVCSEPDVLPSPTDSSISGLSAGSALGCRISLSPAIAPRRHKSPNQDCGTESRTVSWEKEHVRTSQ